ncbi:MAG: hypothetical protein KBT88_12195 [Gammaproteobacteria bacterium]|nr:hypothetical protein [Gammaproteobacteria bacterium]MBQ0840536.1 hypothetical protein [Gammaproteobacteria bacterium]
MTLSSLIGKGGLSRVATQKAATLATHSPDNSPTVATVATVAGLSVAPGVKSGNYSPSVASVAGLTVATHKPAELSSAAEKAVRAWLKHIGETGTKDINRVINQCRTDLKARAYFFEQAFLLDSKKDGLYQAATLAAHSSVTAASKARAGQPLSIVKIAPQLRGLAINFEDRKFIETCLRGKSRERKTALLSEYRQRWLTAEAAEPVPHRKENAGRSAANSWLRKHLK